MPATPPDGEPPLKRLGGGRWQTRDERFTIEPQSGTWVIVDATQTDDLGLPLVRGPFGSLTAAKAAIAEARDAAAPSSPLAERAAGLRDRPTTSPAVATAPAAPKATARKATAPTAPKAAPKAAPAPKDRAVAKELEAPEPSWLGGLTPDDRRRARRLLRQLTDAGVDDAEGLVRRDLAGDVPALAAHAVKAAIAALGPDATPTDVARLLQDGRDAALEVRWRLVDDRGRRISLDR